MPASSTVSADQSKNIRLKYRKGEGRPITFQFLVDSESYDISGNEYVFQVHDMEGDLIFELTEDSGGGLTNGGVTGALTIDPTDADVDIDEKTYLWKLKVVGGITWFNGKFQVNNSPNEETDIDNATVELDLGDITINVELTISDLSLGDVSLTPIETELIFNQDKEFETVLGGTTTFTLGASGHKNAVGIVARINEPVAVNFPVSFEQIAGSDSISTTGMNIIFFEYFKNYDGAGNDKVLYTIKNQTAV